ncbi:uncharacterized protein LOC143291202 isoform X2 [Babylonia areolata]|uniref:uncharacterized protein LOC143291202 isoform X2 n=1 Tax=Babylonia areolata TaxID=304850 RepID=UPI003FD4ACC2
MGTNEETRPPELEKTRKSTKSRKFIKFSPRLRKKSRSAKENAVKAMASEGAAGRELSLQMPNGLNDKEKQDLQSVFDMFDKNRDGKISCEELGVVLRTLGHRYSQAEVEEMISNADKNDNGFVEYDEFILLMKRWSANVEEQGLDEEAREAENARETFKAFDVDGNGFIDRHELRFIMSRLPKSPGEKDIDETDIDEMFRLADLNGDGLIDYEEFTQLMAKMPLSGGVPPPPPRSFSSSSSSASTTRSPAASSSSTTSSSKASSSKGVKKK